MRKPEWLRVKVSISMRIKASAVLRVSLHWAWALLLVYLLKHGQGHLPVH